MVPPRGIVDNRRSFYFRNEVNNMAGEPKPWSPDQPLPDAEDEKEAHVRAQRSRRVRWLEDNVYKDSEPEKKGKKKPGWE